VNAAPFWERSSRFRRERLGQYLVVDLLGLERMVQPFGGLAQEKSNGRSGGGNDAARRGGVGNRQPRRMRRDASPADDTGQAKIIQPARIVVSHACRQQCALPLNRGGFESFELLDGREHAFFSRELCARCEVVPVKQPAHEDIRRDGLDLLAQRAERKPMDALQDAALAPLDLMGHVIDWLRALEDAAHSQALHLHRKQRLVQRAWR